MKIPAELPPAQMPPIVIDTREQTPWAFTHETIPGTLSAGDYSLAGLTDIVAIERKSLPDLLGVIGQGRERFEREIQRLLAYPCRSIIVEATWQDLEAGDWRSQVTPAAAIGSCLAWIGAGVPVVMAGNRDRAASYAQKIMSIAARRRWREARALVAGVLDPETATATGGQS